ncbi:4Fe-4S single cluster domain-containing protein [Umezawaea sp. Da 62-37]|uniref:4Fe-4S single cluster domain-containing protein n=1 Tax=Umezawaea sp. Da 62-37 TaxID=3075927 RepID=UPI0028F72085|nr:4Fe-4S single cluster domain-containing protein [Umezawaea sp. Da 62-37]WNV85320.1 4Fe-4S single cluster domain-containing protein [Umezawaea sp. Da 62-37]
MLRVSRAHFPVTSLGPGRRLGLWLQGCPLACAGCMSRDTWAMEGGRAVAIGDLVELWRDAVRDGAEGLTISGGEPLVQSGPLLEFLEGVREVGAGQDVLLYTGFEPDELDQHQRAVVDRVDAVITGRYRAGEPTSLVWRGSANQRLTPVTALGRARYAACVDLAVENPPMQVSADGGRLFVIGVPPAGALSRMERALRDRGIVFEGVAWRP